MTGGCHSGTVTVVFSTPEPEMVIALVGSAASICKLPTINVKEEFEVVSGAALTENMVPRTAATALPVCISRSLRFPSIVRSFGALATTSPAESSHLTCVRRPVSSLLSKVLKLNEDDVVSLPSINSVPSETLITANPHVPTSMLSPASIGSMSVLVGLIVIAPLDSTIYAVTSFL